eukprot:8975310-Karenia_brevis.AAC.1
MLQTPLSSAVRIKNVREATCLCQKVAPSLEGGGRRKPFQLLESKTFKRLHACAEKQLLALKEWMLQTLSVQFSC